MLLATKIKIEVSQEDAKTLEFMQEEREMSDEEQRCQNPGCRLRIEVIAGHRRRQYCNDTCRQAAHRAKVEAARVIVEEAARQERIQQERAVLIDRYGHLLPKTLDLLQSLQAPRLVEQIARAIAAEREDVVRTYGQERNAITEELLLLGEHIGFPVLKSEIFDLDAGVPAWLAFCDDASLEWLYLAKDAAYLKIQATAGRKRLVQLSR
jgi:hypothetical protein